MKKYFCLTNLNQWFCPETQARCFYSKG